MNYDIHSLISEVDGVTYFTSALPVQAGESYDVLITGAEGEDLIGEVRE